MKNASSIEIPSILKIGKGALDSIGSYMKEASFQQVVIYFGNGLIDLFGGRVMESLKQAGIHVLEYCEIDTIAIDDIIGMAFSLPSQTQAVISIGGGKVIDAGKYAAFLKNLPFVSVPTSSSSDGFSSASASLIVEGRRTSVPARLACGIIVDTEVIRTAPQKFIYSGIGDMPNIPHIVPPVLKPGTVSENGYASPFVTENCHDKQNNITSNTAKRGHATI